MAHDYRVESVRRVVDGDTVDLTLDLGFYLHGAYRFRLLGIDAPERGTPGAAEATAYAREWLAEALTEAARPGVQVRATSHKADSFGRWLADVYLRDADGAVLGNLTRDLLIAGHGTPRAR